MWYAYMTIKGEYMTGILTIQIKPVKGKIDINLKKIEHFIDKNADKKLDLVIMPEFFTTGAYHDEFLNSPVDDNGGYPVEFIQKLAKKYNTNIIAGTVIEKSQDKLYNTSFAIDRTGKTIAKYRKIHLFNYLGGTEGKLITPGTDEVIADFDFGKVGMEVCFDIRYPLQIKNLVKAGAQIVVLPTAWLVPDEIYNNPQTLEYAKEMWIAMNRMRAYDNGVYFVSSNQTGQPQTGWGAIGTSLIISPTAQILANAKEKQCAVYADIDLEQVKYLKSLYPVASID